MGKGGVASAAIDLQYRAMKLLDVHVGKCWGSVRGGGAGGCVPHSARHRVHMVCFQFGRSVTEMAAVVLWI
jgi:hypothetical protein